MAGKRLLYWCACDYIVVKFLTGFNFLVVKVIFYLYV